MVLRKFLVNIELFGDKICCIREKENERGAIYDIRSENKKTHIKLQKSSRIR